MGDWADTCMLSQLPIRWHTETVFIPLRESHDWRFDGAAGGSVHGDELWFPAGLPWFGKYDDAGCIEDPKPMTPGLEALTLEYLKGCGVTGTVPQVLDILERAEKTKHMARDLGTNNEHDVRLGRALIRRDVWDWVVGADYEDPRDFAASVEERPPVQLTRKMYRDEAFKWLKGYYEVCRSSDDTRESFRRLMQYEVDTEYTNRYRRSLGCEGRYWASDWNRYVRNQILYNQRGPDDVRDDLYGVVDMVVLDRWMQFTRHSWYPPCGKGSQDELWDLHEAFHQKVAAIAGSERQRREDSD